MPKAKVNRKNLKIIEGNKPPAPAAAQGLSANEAEFMTAMFFWPFDLMRLWMPTTRTGS